MSDLNAGRPPDAAPTGGPCPLAAGSNGRGRDGRNAAARARLDSGPERRATSRPGAPRNRGLASASNGPGARPRLLREAASRRRGARPLDRRRGRDMTRTILRRGAGRLGAVESPSTRFNFRCRRPRVARAAHQESGRPRSGRLPPRPPPPDPRTPAHAPRPPRSSSQVRRRPAARRPRPPPARPPRPPSRRPDGDRLRRPFRAFSDRRRRRFRQMLIPARPPRRDRDRRRRRRIFSRSGTAATTTTT